MHAVLEPFFRPVDGGCDAEPYRASCTNLVSMPRVGVKSTEPGFEERYSGGDVWYSLAHANSKTSAYRFGGNCHRAIVWAECGSANGIAGEPGGALSRYGPGRPRDGDWRRKLG